VASALAPHGRVSEEREAEVGWHLLAAGDRETAAKHLEAAGRRLCSAQSLGDAVEPLAAALEVYEEQDASAALRFDVRRMLVMAGVLGDIKTLRRYSEEALEATWHYAGLSVAARWGPRIGRPAALVLGLAVAGVRHLFTSRARRGPSPIDAFGFSLIVCSVLTTYLSTAFTDVQRLPQLLTRMRVFEAFKKQIPYGSLLACTNNLDVERGLYARARSRCAQSAEIVGTDRRTPITEDERKAALAMVHGQDCFTRLVVHDSEYEVALERLQGLGLVSVAFGANMYRALYHRMRGEEEQAQALFRKAEGERLRAGDGWIWNSQSAWVSTLAYAGTRDVLGLKRSIELLDRYIEDGFGFTAIRDLAEGEYRRTRGDLEGAREVLEPLLDRQDAPGFVVPNALAALAETYLLLGDTEKAKRAASMGSAVASAEDSGNVPVRLRCQVVLGLLEEGEGDSAAAVERLDRVVHEAEAQASPTLAGMAHEARARLASALDDADGVARHVAAMERWVRPTRNPALLQRLEQTQVLAGGVLPARQEGADETVTAEAQLQTVDPSQIAAAFRSARSVKERAEIALEALLRCTGGSHGFLFERNGRGLELLAPEHGQEPPTELRDSLDAIVRENDERAGGSRPSGPALKRAFHPVVLRDPDGGQCVAAAAIVPTADSRGLTPPPEVLQELARGLIEIAGLAG
jgi:tetratricopeptide (TPR) repeat protein